FGHLPLLEVDGRVLPTAYAINRYLAKKFGFAGASLLEAMWVDALADLQQDYFNLINPLYPVILGFVKGDLEQMQKDIAIP
ncbi:hypothetical protein PENTCL1PPCAC_9747, partial [Pristionchus entomophagus]